MGFDDILQFWGEPEDRDGKLTVWSTCKIDGLFFPGVADLDDAGCCIAMVRASRVLLTDKLKPLGRNNQRLLHHGYAPANIDIEVKIWTIDQWRAWLKYFPKIDPARKITKTTKTTKIVLAQGPPAPATEVASGVALSAATGDVLNVSTTSTDTPTAKVTETKTTQEIPCHTIEHPDLDFLGIHSIYITEIDPWEDGDVWGLRVCRIKAVEIIKSDDKVVSKGVAEAAVASATQVAPGFEGLDKSETRGP